MTQPSENSGFGAYQPQTRPTLTTNSPLRILHPLPATSVLHSVRLN